MKSMFYKLFGGIVFVTMLLGNIVMASMESVDDVLYDALKKVFTCKGVEKYTDDCMVNTLNNIYSESEEMINKVNNLYENHTGDTPTLFNWVVTLTAFTQDRRYSNEDYNKRNNIDSKYVASMDSFIRKYEDTGLRSDALCQLLIYRVVLDNDTLQETVDNIELSRDQMKELETVIMNLTSGCVFEHDKKGNVVFKVLWFEDELIKYINDYHYLMEKYENR